ncbi:MAG TPA: FAD-binding oxidoreductase [Candidatus Acidoferrum sp.]|nr:FAD-binding oxidoreductase [Candidatus Acidoferrum sp.]
MSTITNWFGDLSSQPAVIAEATSTAEVIAILRDPVRYPSPVRAIGSFHSTAACGEADGGTMIRMGKMNRILSVGQETVTVEAGAIYIDIAKELEKQGLQFYINTEIGNLTAGSAACCGTKDSSMPGEFGQVGSYITGVKMVLPDGSVREIGAAQEEELQKVRSSYGTFGIITEVTYKVRALQPLAVHHETYPVAEFVDRLPELLTAGESVMLYLFPFEDLVTIEFRRYNPAAEGEPNRVAWPLRNYMWATAGPAFCARVDEDVPIPELRYQIIDGFCQMWRFKLENLVKNNFTVPGDQIIRYPSPAGASKYTFSFWAIPEENYAAVLPEFFAFCRKYYETTGYRTNMLYVGYRVLKDQESLLSYSWNGNMITIDPVSTANPGWTQFLTAYNEFCSDHGGVPLLNQTPGLTRGHVVKALGDRWQAFATARREYDPGNRLLSAYFRDLLGE